MRNNFLSKLLFASLLMTSLAGCQKDSNPVANLDQDTKDVLQSTPVDERSPFIYGVTVWTSSTPSKVVKIDFATGAVVSWVNVTWTGGVTVKDIKGICTVGGTYYVTTGANNAVGMQYMLMKLDPNTGIVSAAFNPGYGAPISDICFRDVTPLGIYGLKDNSNQPVRINYNGGLWNTTTPFAATGIPPSLTPSGLCWGKGVPGFQIFIAAGDALGNVKVYTWDPASGLTTGITGLTPSADFPSANLGMGYFSFSGIGLINRRSTSPGLNKISWGPAMLPGTGLWGATGGYIFEDMCTVQ